MDKQKTMLEACESSLQMIRSILTASQYEISNVCFSNTEKARESVGNAYWMNEAALEKVEALLGIVRAEE